jgi:hypothetical protein
MAFNTHSSGSQDDSKDRPTVDFDAVNKYVVEKAGLQDRETLIGYISQIVDLGTQELPDAEATFVGDAADEAKLILEKPDTYFKDGIDYDTKKPVRLKCWPQKPQPCVAFAVDFSDILLDKGQFFEDRAEDMSKALPLRLWMGGQFYMESSGMIVNRPTPLKYTNLDKTRKTKVWSLAQNNIAYKMALGAKIIKAGDTFLPDRIDELLGKSLQFSAQVYFKASKGKEYYTEYVNYVGALSRGQVEAELLTTPYVIQFTEHNDETAVKQLRNHVVNTIKRASNYEGSVLQGQIEKGRNQPAEGAKEDKPTPKPKAKAPKVRPAPADDFDSFDEDCPF